MHEAHSRHIIKIIRTIEIEKYNREYETNGWFEMTNKAYKPLKD